MNERQELLVSYVEKARKLVFDGEDFLWTHPEVGFTEWESHNYLKARWEEMGYKVIEAGNIPGFYADLDTGRPGPTLCIMGELDALDIANHPCSVNGKNHSCGHCAQGAAMLGVAAGLAGEHALDGLSGKIRLMMVPAEEMIQLPFREELRQKGIIHFIGGKPEFMYRGYFDDVDLCLMVHTGSENQELDFGCNYTNNGCLAKTFTYTGRAAHAAGSPYKGINAEYAAMLGLNACNALRETFQDSDHIRFHPIVHGVETAVNIIPNEITLETYVRASTTKAIVRENKKINRALAGAAASMGAKLTIHDRPGYTPEIHFHPFMKLVEKCCTDLSGPEKVKFRYDGHGTGSSDFGDLTSVMPGVQFRAYGAIGSGHGTDYYIKDVEKACVRNAMAQVLVANELLQDDAKAAKEIIDAYEPTFGSVKEYVEFMDSLIRDIDAVTYGDDDTVTITY